MPNTVLEVGIGLIILYSLLAVLCSAISELLASAFSLRARNLREGIENLLGDNVAEALYCHPMIRTLYRQEGPKSGFLRKLADRIPPLKRLLFRAPSYLPADKFALALLSLTAPSAVSRASTAPGAPGATAPGLSEGVTRELGSIPDDKLKETLQLLWLDARNDVGAFVRGIQDWFNDAMARVAGWYKRKTQLMLLFLAVGIAVVLNVNTITISQRLWNAAPLRTVVIEQSKKVPPPTTTPDGSFGDAAEDVQDSFKQVSDLQLPMGWGKDQRPSSPWTAVVGWAFTAAALSLGAPFWFDLLNRVSAIRATGTPEKAGKKGSPSPAKG